MDEVIRTMGNPVSREEANGFISLFWENVEVNGYMTYMLAYFSSDGLQGGTYYYLTRVDDLDELMRCYTEVQNYLRSRYGPTRVFNSIIRELRPYDSLWNLNSGSIHLKVNTRHADNVTLWFCSPEMTRQMYGDLPDTTTG
ncbi:MAG: hypothetical protein FWG89_01610 [Treponema sp.]|nr:hypothetical protein [Treponema sp.]